MKNEKLWPKQRRQNSAETDKGSSYNQEKWLEKLLDDKGAFYNGSESDDRNHRTIEIIMNSSSYLRFFQTIATK